MDRCVKLESGRYIVVIQGQVTIQTGQISHGLGSEFRPELIRWLVILDHVEARISELEGRQKPPTEGGKERKPPSWAKANRPDRPKKERQNRAYGFARRREEPTHRVEHARPVVRTAGHCCWAGGCADAARLYPYPAGAGE